MPRLTPIVGANSKGICFAWPPQLQTATVEMRRFGMSAGGNRLDNLRFSGVCGGGNNGRAYQKAALMITHKLGAQGRGVLRRQGLPPGTVALFRRSGTCL
jgi:hypothetical protein